MLRNQMTALTTVVVIAVVVRTASSIEGNATFGILKADGTLFPLIDELFVVEDLPIKMWCSSPEWTGLVPKSFHIQLKCFNSTYFEA